MGDSKRRLDTTGYKVNQLQPGQQIQVDMKNAVLKECECGCKYFVPVIQVYALSALLSPTGQELISHVPVLACKECGKLMK